MNTERAEKWVTRALDEALENYPWARNAIADLRDCYERHGRPDEPGGPSTGAGHVATLSSADDMGEGVTDEDADEHNGAIKALYYAAGYVYAGCGQWHTQYEHTDDWDAYRVEAREIIDDYISNGFFWDDFSADRW